MSRSINTQYVLKLLGDHDLPINMAINCAGAPVGANGAYFPTTNTLALRPGCDDFTILHEGAHAEHHINARLVGNMPSDEPALFGILLASEAYVGGRLAEVSGFIDSEHQHLNNIGASGFPATVGGWAARYRNLDDIKGTNWDGTIRGCAGIRVLMRILPLLRAEQKVGKVSFGSDLDSRVPMPGDILRSIAAATLQVARKDKCLLNIDKLRALGKTSLAKLSAVK